MKRGDSSRMEERERRWEECFIKHHTLVIRNAYYWVRDYHTAEDICQETFIRLLEHLDDIPPEKVKGWLICVSERLAVDTLRKFRSRDAALERMQESAGGTRGRGPDSILEEIEEMQETGEALKALKKARPNWYEAIRMSCLEDMDARAIGKELGVRPSLISKWKERGRRWLKEVYPKKKEDG